MGNTIGNIAEPPPCLSVRCCKTTCTTPDTGDHKLEADIKELDGAIDYHTVENRNKRKALHPTRALGAFTVRFSSTCYPIGLQPTLSRFASKTPTVEVVLNSALFSSGWNLTLGAHA